MPGRIRVEREGHLGWIVFDHPERRNAITAQMWESIPAAVRELDEDAGIRVVGLRGEGEVAFISGADISEFGERRTGDAAAAYDAENSRAYGSIQRIRKPVFALVHGFCVGGGCAIALSADLRFASDDAVFAIPAARLGLGYGAEGIEKLVHTVGLPAAKEIFFTGRRFSAAEAQSMGLVNQVFPKAELDASVRKVAEGIAENAPLTLRSAKQIFASFAQDPAKRDADAIARGIAACYASEDYQEGVRAFLEKRRPEFRGR